MLTLEPLRLFPSTDFGFDAPLTLVMITYFIMFIFSSIIRWRLYTRGTGMDGVAPVQELSWSQWLRKVAPVAAASGLEVRGN